MLGYFEEQPYPWAELVKGLLTIAVAVYMFFSCKLDEDVVTFAMRGVVGATGSVLNVIFLAFETLIHLVGRNYRIPVLVLLFTWWVFPDIVDDLLFLVYLGYQRYKNLFFS